MKAQIEVGVQPFIVPEYVYLSVPCATKKEGYTATTPLTEVDAFTLDKLCSDFRRAVFERAAKSPPPELAKSCPHCERTL